MENVEKSEHPLRILIVTECFWPDIYAINDITEKLVKRGHSVTVLTGLPDYTTTKIPKEYKHGRNRHQNYKGADVYRVSTIARRHGPIFRSLSYLSFVVTGSHFAKTHKFDEFDIIYVWEVSPVTMAVPAIKLKKRYNKPLFLYCMDIWPECVKAMHINEGTLPYKLIHSWTKKIYRKCDHIAVSSRPFFEYLERGNGIKREKMSYLPQFGDSTLLEMDTGIANAASTATNFLFIGNIGKAQNLDCLMKAMLVFKGRRDVHLHMVGGGSEEESIKKLVHDLEIDDLVTFYGPKPFKESLAFYNKADACVLTLDGSTHIGDTLPGKLQTYMAAGKPILAAANGAAAEIIREADCGGCVPAGDYRKYGELLRDFADSDKYTNCGENARKYFRDNFTEEIHFAALEERLYSMTINKTC